MINFPCCKINLGLHIIAKRNDGYHDIETIFYPITDFCDVLEIVPQTKGEKSSFHQVGIPIDVPQGENLVEKAYLLLKSRYNLPSVDMFLLKRIPAGAGLGGGSSDAATCLALLNKLFEIRLNNPQLREFSAQLGSDCSFFIECEAALGKGRGEELYPVSIPQLKGKYILIVKPNLHISTAEAYRNCIGDSRHSIPLPKAILCPLEKWKDNIFNDFEESLFPIYPELREIKNRLYTAGAIYALLSGSGSALFGIFEHLPRDITFDKSAEIFSCKL